MLLEYLFPMLAIIYIFVIGILFHWLCMEIVNKLSRYAAYGRAAAQHVLQSIMSR